MENKETWAGKIGEKRELKESWQLRCEEKREQKRSWPFWREKVIAKAKRETKFLGFTLSLPRAAK